MKALWRITKRNDRAAHPRAPAAQKEGHCRVFVSDWRIVVARVGHRRQPMCV